MAIALASQGKYDGAVAAIEKGISLKPDDGEAQALGLRMS